MILDLDALRDEANAWLLDQPPNRALCPCAVLHFKRRFCLPSWLVQSLEREAEKDARVPQ